MLPNYTKRLSNRPSWHPTIRRGRLGRDALRKSCAHSLASAPRPGLEPRLAGSEPAVLPLHHLGLKLVGVLFGRRNGITNIKGLSALRCYRERDPRSRQTVQLPLRDSEGASPGHPALSVCWVVPLVRVELTCPFGRRILSALRLPVPPQGGGSSRGCGLLFALVPREGYFVVVASSIGRSRPPVNSNVACCAPRSNSRGDTAFTSVRCERCWFSSRCRAVRSGRGGRGASCRPGR